MMFVLVLFRSRRGAKNVLPGRMETGLIILFFFGSFLLSYSALKHLPILDFRPYATGTNIPAAMASPEGAPGDVYNTILFYRNVESGKTEEFTIDNYPQDTIKYEFVTSESRLISKGYEPPIHDFGIIHPDGYEITNEILAFKGYSLILISKNLREAVDEVLISGNDWYALQNFASDFKFYAVSASSSGVVEEISSKLDLEYNFYSGDEIMLKTMIRANPGFILLKNGTIVAKWAYRDFPSLPEWNEKWPGLLKQYKEEQDPEIMILIEEGLMDELSWDMIDFDNSANPIVIKKLMKRTDRSTWLLYFLSVTAVLLLVQFIPKKKNF